ncbi:MAG: hypothetical protein ACRDGD_07080 [Candidatus Limnocylindria bacterium]
MNIKLEDTEWVVVEHLDAAGALSPVAEGIRASVHFSAGRPKRPHYITYR